MNSDLLQRYAARAVPRYTSYPTAPHFRACDDDTTPRAWLSQVPADATLSLYLHVPYCRSLCWYCGCHATVVNGDRPVAEYAGALAREIATLAAAMPHRNRLVHLHWGGGSPNIVPPNALARVMETVRRCFPPAADAELAMELDPRTTRPVETAAILADVGINRASLGVQSFDPRVQKAVNRVQSFGQTLAIADALRRAGIDRLNIDLLYGLPYETTASVIETTERVIDLAPDRIAVFGYAHVPNFKRHQRLLPEDALPDGPARWAQAQAVADRLTGAGYVPVGLDHYARLDDPLAIAAGSGRLRRNFQGYTIDPADVLLGAGMSAIGTLPQGYVQNAASVRDWRAAVDAGRLPVAKLRETSDDDRLRRSVIERLMCDMAVDLAAVAQVHGCRAETFDAERPQLALLAQDGLIDLDGNRITVRADCHTLVRTVAAVFDRYLGQGNATHAKAV